MSNFQKSPSRKRQALRFPIAKRWGFCVPNAPLTSDFGGLKLRDLHKLCFSKLIVTNLTLKISYEVILVMLSLLRHRKTNADELFSNILSAK